MKPSKIARIAYMLVCLLYGATMILLIYQFKEVGVYATCFRFVAWQVVLLDLFLVHKKLEDLINERNYLLGQLDREK